MLCDICQNIFLGNSPYSHKVHHQTASSLLLAAQKQCAICTRLYARSSQDGQLDLLSLQGKGPFVYCLVAFGFNANIPIAETSMTLEFLVNPSKFPRRLRKRGSRDTFSSIFIMQPIKDITSLVQNHQIPFSTASDASFRLVHEWIATCDRDHIRCARPLESASYYPTRLIEIRQAGLELRVRNTNEDPPEGPYMTLSHCWGEAQFLKLTTLNVENLQDKFAISDLPRSFRDAVSITWKLGIRYLWIDSLCILQDSVADWRQEAATMKDVYQNSFCSIAATGASNSDQGCFTDRDPSLILPCTIDSAWVDHENETYHIVDANFLAELETAPLNRRAWVVQERLLASRVLHYGRGQLFWECHELEACETFPRGLPPDLVGTGFKGLEPHTNGKRRRAESNQEPDSDLDAYHLWDTIVQAFTRSSLTKPEDKLIALSGLASRVQQILDDEYLAGLWKRILPSQLMWEVYDGRQGNELPAVRPAQYRAPSWSWASLDGCVGWDDISQKGFLITIIETHVTPIVNNPMSQVKDGFIRLQGDLIAAELYRNEKELHASLGLRVESHEFAPDNHPNVIGADVETDQIDGIFYCLPLKIDCVSQETGGKHDYSYISGLILRSTGSRKGTYQRFGVFSLDGLEFRQAFTDYEIASPLQDHLYDDATQQTLILI